MNTLKNLLTSAPVLQNPDFDRKFYLHCDASDFGIGAVLVQISKDGEEMPIAFMSRKLSKSQRNYSVTERECLAVILAIEKFRCYLEMQPFEVVTDHSSLQWLMRQQEVTGRLARWVFRLQSFSFKVTHRKGKDHIVPDALSRISADEIASYELIAPEIDLESTSFLDPEYLQMKARIIENSEQFPDLQVVDRFVYIRTEHVSGNEELDSAKWKLWVPEPLRASAIHQAHDSNVNAHGCMQKTIERLRRNFYWPGLSKEVRYYVRNCEICKETKAPTMTLRPPMGQQSISVRPFQKLYVDFLGPYPRSKKGNIGLLIVLVHFSRYH